MFYERGFGPQLVKLIIAGISKFPSGVPKPFVAGINLIGHPYDHATPARLPLALAWTSLGSTRREDDEETERDCCLISIHQMTHRTVV